VQVRLRGLLRRPLHSPDVAGPAGGEARGRPLPSFDRGLPLRPLGKAGATGVLRIPARGPRDVRGVPGIRPGLAGGPGRKNPPLRGRAVCSVVLQLREPQGARIRGVVLDPGEFLQEFPAPL